MRKIIKIINTLVLCSTLTLGLAVQSFASSNDAISQGSIDEAIANTNVVATMTDNVTGEVVALEATKTKVMARSSDSVAVTYEVSLPLALGSNLRSSDSSTKDNDYATASLTAVYTRKDDSSGRYIKVSRLYGGWTGNNSLIYFSDRKCGMKDGLFDNSMSKSPTSNSFSYNTGWGYVDYVDADEGPFMSSSAKVWVSGMEHAGSQTLSIATKFGS
ncbi:hypothetical protein [Anaerotignum propionicum]|uniref:hypothetical protein n=1 Tax=Anaerotignum propionicum TaxID=28446 RepID=UPI00210B7DAA|nr:hypothetical protein [Anaerotignum propionicum]MCQ4936350.1 hypothetical protein [Anaerotignum propionicum]